MFRQLLLGALIVPGYCYASAGSGFVEGTKIRTLTSMQNIESMRKHQYAKSHKSASRISDIQTHISNSVKITTEHFAVIASEDQKFYVNAKLKKASEIEEGMHIVVFSAGKFKTETVKSITQKGERTTYALRN